MRPTQNLCQSLRTCSGMLHRPTVLSRTTAAGGYRPFSQLLPPRTSSIQARARTLIQTPERKSIPYTYKSIRHNSSSTSNTDRPLTDAQSNPASDAEREEQNRKRREQEPAYQITFTCKPCGQRSSHRMSKHGYHNGTVLISCPSCKNRHVISDHLNIFFDKRSTLEDILQEQGKKLTKGHLDGDVEFWDDGTVRKSGGQD